MTQHIGSPQDALRSTPHVLIVGAGSTGLLVAQGLKKIGVAFSIFEARPNTNHVRDWSMGFHWGRDLLAGILPSDILNRIDEADADASLCNEEEAKQRFSDDMLRRCFSIPEYQETH